MNLEELTPAIRVHMLDEFRVEQLGTVCAPYRPRVLTALGESVFVSIMEEHLANGDEVSLALALSPSSYWFERGTRNTKKGPVSYFMSGEQRAKVFAITDFNTWYVRGLCRQLLLEGVKECEVYRTAPAYEPRGECLSLEGHKLSVLDVYDGHRRRYHPETSKDITALSIPAGPNCHHSIRRTAAYPAAA